MTDASGAVGPVAFLGLGRMGLPMASRLVAAGFAVTGYDPAEAARVAFTEAGGRCAATAESAAEGAAVLIAMLPDGAAVRAALDGVSGLLAPGSLVLDMSSSAPVGTRTLAEDLGARGIALVDAPVSGGVKRAVDGSLAIMAGGEPAAVARVRPLLDAMGAAVFETGAVGTAHAMKALNNYVSAAGLAAACEALQVGAAFGLDPALMTDILNVSTGRNNSTEVKLKPFVIPKTYASGFSMALMSKDLRTADDLARQLGVPAPLSRAVSALWAAALDDLGPGADHTAIDAYVAKPSSAKPSSARPSSAGPSAGGEGGSR